MLFYSALDITVTLISSKDLPFSFCGVSVSFAQLQSKAMRWKIPEVNNSKVLSLYHNRKCTMMTTVVLLAILHLLQYLIKKFCHSVSRVKHDTAVSSV